MSDQNNAPERIWIKPCDPCENPYDYYVCDPRYLDGRETSYVKSIVSCAGCGGGLKRQSGQLVCRDCGKAETVQDVLARADRAAPADNTALVEKLRQRALAIRSLRRQTKTDIYDAELDEAAASALANREAPPACQQEAVTESDLAAARAENERLTKERDESNACNRGLVRLNEAVVARAEKAEAERDEARAEHRFTLGLLDKAMAERDEALALLADAYGAGTGGSVIEAHLADAERDMRQRAADACKAYWDHPDAEASPQVQYDAILALPLKHSDRGGVV
ncbi:hypothetical protein [Paracoccus yeei]|uniref:hypothetical protein n=1 Tax=Paracoccus yeei TaxID=147645 RepID=UPI0028D406DA|nr:hypothetical protein [Paracoccus yeei]